MTTSVKITNNGPLRVNVNEVEPDGPRMAGKEKTVQSHTLFPGDERTIIIWGDKHYLCVIETNDVDTDDSKTAITWVVERYVNSRLCYWAPGARGRSSRDDWSEDFAFAVRFSDMPSADAVMIHAGGGEGRVRAHRLIDRNTPAPC